MDIEYIQFFLGYKNFISQVSDVTGGHLEQDEKVFFQSLSSPDTYISIGRKDPGCEVFILSGKLLKSKSFPDTATEEDMLSFVRENT